MPLRAEADAAGCDRSGPFLSFHRFTLSQVCRPSKFCFIEMDFPQSSSVAFLLRLATVTRFSSRPFAPLAAICRSSFLAPPS
jgi:hypothetical protein